MEQKADNPNSPRINCIKCVNYFVTWDNNFPHGCRSMDFKSRNIPSQEVFSASGMKCQFFHEKIIKKDSKP